MKPWTEKWAAPKECPKCQMELINDLPGIKGPGNQWAHAVYYGGDFGYWCVFEWAETATAAEPVKPRRRMFDRR